MQTDDQATDRHEGAKARRAH